MLTRQPNARGHHKPSSCLNAIAKPANQANTTSAPPLPAGDCDIATKGVPWTPVLRLGVNKPVIVTGVIERSDAYRSVSRDLAVLKIQLHYIDTPIPNPEKHKQQKPRLFVKSALTANGPGHSTMDSFKTRRSSWGTDSRSPRQSDTDVAKQKKAH
ncbi:hypothetical protein BFJ69_g5903 [Fusarium oxysporum]|uniref:Uncharacterized protein n=1 Tax=Fusarium oxysporum TaxID=5507 RepID=A0A420NCB8_FUSOX|nr:hypothetical protein BFJ69_g5903 [Fusarium oxysporum]